MIDHEHRRSSESRRGQHVPRHGRCELGGRALGRPHRPDPFERFRPGGPRLESQTVDNHPGTRPPPGFTSELTVLLLEVLQNDADITAVQLY